MMLAEITKHEKKLMCLNLANTLSIHLCDGVNAHNHFKNPHKTDCQIRINGASIFITMPYLGKSNPSNTNYAEDIDADYKELCTSLANVCKRYNTLPKLVAFGTPDIFRYGEYINIDIPVIKAKPRFSKNDYNILARRLCCFMA